MVEKHPIVNYTWIDAYLSDLQRYSFEQLRFIPEPGVWSLCQMYDHLILAALDYFEKIAECATDGEEQGQGKTEAGEELFALGGFPPVKIKLPDGPENSPSNSESHEDLASRLELVKWEMMKWEERVPAINPNRKVRHDGFGWLNALEWFALTNMHFRHHLRQKEELEQRWTAHIAGIRHA
ncbi:DinB family protein [Paenibacillus nanensis]|uniref:DinB family protein n=1 Tax=Paenibacillus nanensis TaxID=393251 RepID=A0A3A1UVX4_9BACL|nr:DinB family protein [Paenibacillus nanensis]RIX52689.1 DinB family protein [Paenibacillus nanensis]